MIRSFRLGDIFVVQRLANQATKLNAAQALLFPRSASLNALSAVIPWGDARITTYILNQQGHQLASIGFVQVQKRASRPEADILLLAPALDQPAGHPAVWEKLLSYYLQEAASTGLERIYCDAPDQPLPVNTLKHVGFSVYSRDTVWRLTRDLPYLPPTGEQALIRPIQSADKWALSQLYARVTPRLIQRAEGIQPGQTDSPPIFHPRRQGTYHTFLLEHKGDVEGCIQIRTGRRGVWLRLWADTLNPDLQTVRLLLHHALAVLRESSLRPPVYMNVSEHHGGLGAVLTDYGFAPFTDRAKMVKYVVQWVRENASAYASTLEPVADALPSRFVLPSTAPDSARKSDQAIRKRGVYS